MPRRARHHSALRTHPGGWNQSRPTAAPRLWAWLFAIAVVAAFAVGLHELYY